jgi:hypothetical protein
MSPTFRFVPAMYASVLSGRKTQHRHVITPQPIGESWEPGVPNCEGFTPYRTVEMPPEPHCGVFLSEDCLLRKATYGPPGTTLPIVTTWAAPKELDILSPYKLGWGVLEDHSPTGSVEGSLWFNNGTPKPDWAGKSRPAMFFPKSLYPFARQARVTAVKAERVQSISPMDCIAEGYSHAAEIIRQSDQWNPHEGVLWYEDLWDSIYATCGKGESKGQYAWDKNPWVFATTFELV